VPHSLGAPCVRGRRKKREAMSRVPVISAREVSGRGYGASPGPRTSIYRAILLGEAVAITLVFDNHTNVTKDKGAAGSISTA